MPGNQRVTRNLALKDDQPSGRCQGRRYDPKLAQRPGGIKLDDMVLGMKLSALAYTDDKPGTLEAYLPSMPWNVRAVEEITGGAEPARKPLTSILQSMGFTVDRIFSHTSLLPNLQPVDTQGFIAHNEHDVVIAYRGSVGVTDWLVNFGFAMTEFEPLIDKKQGHSGFFACCEGRCDREKPRITKGFYDGWLVTLPDMEEVLTPVLKSTAPRRFILTGHSLGGATATIAFAYLLKAFKWHTLPHKVVLEN